MTKNEGLILMYVSGCLVREGITPESKAILNDIINQIQIILDVKPPPKVLTCEICRKEAKLREGKYCLPCYDKYID